MTRNTLLPVITPETIPLLDFAKRHFDPSFIGTRITTMTPDDFVAILRTNYPKSAKLLPSEPESPVQVFVLPNFTGCKSGQARITDANRSLLKSGMRTRREGEQPYFSQWFSNSDVTTELAQFLHIVLYSRAHLADQGIKLDPGMQWGIVSINAEQVETAVPMHPETMKRNASGIDAGGNGCQYTTAQLNASTAYHSQWANVGE